MKQFYLVFLAFIGVFPIALHAQIELNNSGFPKPGDVYRIAVAENPAIVAFTAPGPNQIWDFRGLIPRNIRETNINPASTNRFAVYYPNATMVVVTDTVATFMHTNSTQVLVSGFVTESKELQLDSLLFFANPNYIVRKVPLKYGDNDQASTVYIGADKANAWVKNFFPTADSARVIVTFNRKDTVDAWGTVKMDNKDSEVLRIKSITTQTNKVEIRVPGSGWATLFTPSTEVLNNLLFVNNDLIEPLIQARPDATGLKARLVNFKYDGPVSTRDLPAKTTLKAVCQPNPSPGSFSLNLQADHTSKATFRVFSLIGEEKYSLPLQLQPGSNQLHIDLNSLTSSIYPWTIQDEYGRILAQDKLLLIKP
jgi:hypothetical protein